MTDFTDGSWASLAPGKYMYAVSTLLPDGSESAKAETPFMLRDMYGSVTAHVSTNSHSGNAAGAVATLDATDGSGVSREATVAGDGTVTFADGLLRSTYTLSLSLPGYNFEPVDVNLMQTKDVVLDNLVMQEIIADPVNVELTGSFEDGFRLTWNESGDFTDDFEGHEAFAQASAGEVGWQYRDGDGARTFAEADFDFPGRTQPGSFMVFNPWMTTPSMADFRQASLPYSGKYELACFAGFTGSDDWFISPRLTYHDPFTFSFWARGYSQTYGEVIRVGYSKTDLNPDSFEWLGEQFIEVPKQVWTKYEFTVPAEARYVAVNCVSPDGFTLFMDDVTIASGKNMPMNTAVTGPEVKYVVTLDGEKVAETDACEYTFAGLPKDLHTAEVKAVYASGESAPVAVTFGESGIAAPEASAISVGPNPAPGYTEVKGDFEAARLYTLSGALLKSFPGGEAHLDLTGVTPGFYILVVEPAAGAPVSVKLIVK